MTDQEKQAEAKREAERQAGCERLCHSKYSEGSGLHTIAPVLCPVQDHLWKNPKRK